MSELLALDVALDLARRLAALAVALSSLETLVLARELASGGALVRETPRLSTAGSRRWVLILAVGRLVVAGWLVVDEPAWASAGLAFLLAATVWTHARFRWGNSGADPMIAIVLLASTVAALRPDSELVRWAAVAAIAGHAAVAYLTTGLAKLLDPRWRSGRYLQAVAGSRTFGGGVTARLLAPLPAARAASWAVITFELAFPLAFLDPRAAVVLCASGLAFHLGNAFFLGLKSFVLAFAATYPAVIACAAALS